MCTPISELPSNISATMVGREIKGIVGIVFISLNFMVKLFYHLVAHTEDFRRLGGIGYNLNLFHNFGHSCNRGRGRTQILDSHQTKDLREASVLV